MKTVFFAASAALIVSAGSAFADEDVNVGGAVEASCTISNNGSASVTLDQAVFDGIDGGNAVTVELGQFNVYCNQPSTLRMSSTNGALRNDIDLGGAEDNGHKLIPYTMKVESDNDSFNQENFFVPAAHAAGLTGGQGFRKNKSSKVGIVDDSVTYTMRVNDDSRTSEQLAESVQDSSKLYAGDYSETATLSITPAN